MLDNEYTLSDFKPLGETPYRAANGQHLGEMLIQRYGQDVYSQTECLGLCAAIRCEHGDDCVVITPDTQGGDLLIVAYGNQAALETAADMLNHFQTCTECLDGIHTDLVQEAVEKHWIGMSPAERVKLCRQGECSIACALEEDPPEELRAWLEDEVYHG